MALPLYGSPQRRRRVLSILLPRLSAENTQQQVWRGTWRRGKRRRLRRPTGARLHFQWGLGGENKQKRTVCGTSVLAACLPGFDVQAPTST